MPIYEYQCEDCKTPFEVFIRSVTHLPQVECPECGSERVEKQVSSVSGSGADEGGSVSYSSCSSGG